jgi:threonine dehydrogenase-like Zn-dependent dehydrogenase
MKAMTVIPGQPGSAEITEIPEPPLEDGAVLVAGQSVGICGTDGEILHGYGEPPAGQRRLVLGHESLGQVLDAPAGSGFEPGDLVMGVVRRPDPQPCAACASDQWDFCENGQYTERGIKGRHGYGASQWRADPRFLIPVPRQLGDLGVLTEPASVVAKGWEQADRFAERSPRSTRAALIIGAGPIGLLAALLAAQRGYETHVLDQVTSGPKPDLVATLGATYHHGSIPGIDVRPDVVIECTGVGQILVDLAGNVAQAAVICLAGLASGAPYLKIDMEQLNSRMVLDNAVIFGTVNASRKNYRQAVDALTRADPRWLGRLITRRVPLSSWPEALTKAPDDVKVVVDLRA